MIQHPRYIVMGLSLTGDWYKPEQPTFGSEKQAANWIKNQLAYELLDDDHDYYLGRAMTCSDLKARFYKERGNGTGNSMSDRFEKAHHG